MKPYMALIKSSILKNLAYRALFYFTSAGNIIVVIIIYFLWSSIYKGSGGIMHGMTFNETFVYLSMAATLSSLIGTHIEWTMANSITDGSIVIHLLKPLDFQCYLMSHRIGDMIFNFIFVTIPAIALLGFVFKAQVFPGINLLFFFISVILAFLLSFLLDFITGIIAFYTQSIWGTAATKDVIVLVLSGAVVPLNFFPDTLRRIIQLFPFQAIYNLPLQVLLNKIPVYQYWRVFGVQLIWIVILLGLSRLFFRKAVRVLPISGG